MLRRAKRKKRRTGDERNNTNKAIAATTGMNRMIGGVGFGGAGMSSRRRSWRFVPASLLIALVLSCALWQEESHRGYYLSNERRGDPADTALSSSSVGSTNHKTTNNETTVSVKEVPASASVSTLEPGSSSSEHHIHVPEVAWLMSFGGSGTSYTILNVERSTNTTTASNYGDSFHPCVPVPVIRHGHSDSDGNNSNNNGPFLRSPSKPLPSEYILTKTHCGGYCMDCPPVSYAYGGGAGPSFSVETAVGAFDRACRTGTKNAEAAAGAAGAEGGHRVRVAVTYEASAVPVARAVHLIRDPFDNLVSRLHLAMKRKRRNADSRQTRIGDDGVGKDEIDKDPEQVLLDSFAAASSSTLDATGNRSRSSSSGSAPEVVTTNNATDALRVWCRYLDDKYADRERESNLLDSSMLDRYRDLPCRAEWFRYVQWHNLAWSVTNARRLPVHYLRYEDYTNRYNETVYDLLQFLRLSPRTGSSEPFVPGKRYRNLFGEQEARLAARMVKEIALPAVWKLLLRYFNNVHHNPSVGVLTKSHRPPIPDASVETEEANATSAEELESLPKVAWLMSFPNSGTSYTITNTERMSNRTTATNYAGENVGGPLHADRPGGPFVHKVDMSLPDSYVLTKTHCAGYCDDCPTNLYGPSTITGYDFERGCRSGFRYDNRTGSNVPTLYDNDVAPFKAVHLIRNPFDNMVSRMHLAVTKRSRLGLLADKQLAAFNQTSGREGFRSWCNYMDGKFSLAVERQGYVAAFSDDVLNLLNGIPCGADFLRYVLWHNRAVELTDRLDLPVHVLHYEDYTADMDGTVRDLFLFLDLPVSRPLHPFRFIPGKTYVDWFESHQIESVERLVRATATTRCWSLLRRYFVT